MILLTCHETNMHNYWGKTLVFIPVLYKLSLKIPVGQVIKAYKICFKIEQSVVSSIYLIISPNNCVHPVNLVRRVIPDLLTLSVAYAWMPWPSNLGAKWVVSY